MDPSKVIDAGDILALDMKRAEMSPGLTSIGVNRRVKAKFDYLRRLCESKAHDTDFIEPLIDQAIEKRKVEIRMETEAALEKIRADATFPAKPEGIKIEAFRNGEKVDEFPNKEPDPEPAAVQAPAAPVAVQEEAPVQ